MYTIQVESANTQRIDEPITYEIVNHGKSFQTVFNGMVMSNIFLSFCVFSKNPRFFLHLDSANCVHLKILTITKKYQYISVAKVFIFSVGRRGEIKQ